MSLSRKDICFFQAFTEFILPKSGPYAVLLTVKDKAKNFKMARRLLLFDNASMIEINEENPSIIKSADTETEFKWINKLTPRVEVSWVGRFINKMVHTNGWLNETATDEKISRDLDDNMGASARNTSSIYNIDGTFQYSLQYLQSDDTILYKFAFIGQVIHCLMDSYIPSLSTGTKSLWVINMSLNIKYI